MSVDRSLPGVREALTRGLTVFAFHDITDTPSPYLQQIRGYTTPDVFREQLRWIHDRFQIIGPRTLPQLGEKDTLPRGAALITFDDAWAGVFRTGLPILQSLRIPALCFLNMATVAGAPDLGAVRHWERRRAPDGTSSLDLSLDAEGAAEMLQRIVETYGADGGFAAYQGATASVDDLRRAGESESVCFGSHLYHHWDVCRIPAPVLLRSIQENASALQSFDNVLPVLATPYGRDLPVTVRLQDELGIKVVFTAHGWQNRDPGRRVIDRVFLSAEPSGPTEWWWSTHRRRVLGPLPTAT